MPSIKPPRLKKGDLIGLVAPASTPAAAERIEGGVRYLEQLGYRTVVGKHVTDQYGYLAGSDADRAADLNAMIRNRNVKAIFCIRGGYGTPRMISLVDYAALRRDPKIFVGYSDITALQLAMFRKTGLITFSGPMTGVEMWKGDRSVYRRTVLAANHLSGESGLDYKPSWRASCRPPSRKGIRAAARRQSLAPGMSHRDAIPPEPCEVDPRSGRC